VGEGPVYGRLFAFEAQAIPDPMRLATIIALLPLIVGCKQHPARFACDGEMRVLSADDEVTMKQVYSLAVDLAAGTVTVGNYEPAPIVGDRNDTVVFMAKPEWTVGVSTGTLNRITGEASIHIIPLTGKGLHIFEGTCKPAAKLF
jgi:hypothetical protein